MELPVTLQPRERVLLTVKRHPIYVILKIISAAAAGLIPAVLLRWLGLGVAGATGLAATLLWGVGAAWVLFWVLWAFFVWYRHQHDLWIITNQRLLDLYKRDPFHQTLSSADLVNVQDISVSRSGLFATLFRFGDVRCQTAGTNASFILSGVPNPNGVLATIDQARDTARLEIARGELPGEGAVLPRVTSTPARFGVPDSIPRSRPPTDG